MITPELVRKHVKRLMEVTVKGYTRRSKTGKVYGVRSYNRDVKSLIGKRLSFKNTIASGDTDAYGSRMSGIFKGLDGNGDAILKQAKRNVVIPVDEIPALRNLKKKVVLGGDKPKRARPPYNQTKAYAKKNMGNFGLGWYDKSGKSKF